MKPILFKYLQLQPMVACILQMYLPVANIPKFSRYTKVLGYIDSLSWLVTTFELNVRFCNWQMSTLRPISGMYSSRRLKWLFFEFLCYWNKVKVELFWSISFVQFISPCYIGFYLEYFDTSLYALILTNLLTFYPLKYFRCQW